MTIVLAAEEFTILKEAGPETFVQCHSLMFPSGIESYNADTIQIAKHELPIGRLYKFDVNRVLNASSATN